MKNADDSVENRCLGNIVHRYRQDIAHEHVLEMLGLSGGFAHGKDGRRRGHGVGNSDKCLLRNVAAPGTREGKDSSAGKGKSQAKPIGA